jgi:hypothetical protein
MLGRVTLEGVEQDSGSDDHSYSKAKDAGIEDVRTPEIREVKE